MGKGRSRLAGLDWVYCSLEARGLAFRIRYVNG